MIVEGLWTVSEQEEFWDRRAAAWDRHAEALDEFSSRFGDPAMDALDPRPGERVLDIGSGAGTTALELARRVAPSGNVVGVDLSGEMVAVARVRAERFDEGHVRFEVVDAQSGSLGEYDAAYSRFGVMFFPEPEVAFANIAASLVDGGRFACVVWAALGDNPWMFVPMMFASGPLAAHVTPPGPDQPGPFSLADPEHVREILEGAGFDDIVIERLEDARVLHDDTVRDEVAEMLEVGPLGASFAEATPEAREAAIDAVIAGCEDHRSDGGWRLPAAAWMVTATVRR